MKRTLLLSCLTLGSLSLAQAGTTVTADSKVPETAVAPKEESVFDKIWGLAKFYKDDSNPIIEEFDFTGRFQADYFHNDTDKGTNDFFEIRRFRLGEDAFFFNRHLEIKTDVDTALRNYHKDPLFYNRLTSLYAQIKVNDSFNLRLGKQEPHFGYDREVSDNNQPFFERTFFDDQVFNDTGKDYQTAATVFGKFGSFGYLASVISLDVDKELGQFNGGQAYLAELNYDFKKQLSADKALWAVTYIHSDPNKNADVFNTIHNAVATYFDYKKGPLGLVSQIGYMDGIGNKGDIWEAMIMPTYDITEKLQMELRYSYGHGSNANSITILNRQTSTIGKFTGDEFNEAYLGMNYFIYGYKLRLMAGVEYFDLSGGAGAKADNSGWLTLVGFRLYW